MAADRRFAPMVLLTAIVATGCLGGSSLDIGTPVNLHVWTTPTSVEVDAPGWITDASRLYLCAAEPPRPPEGAAEREGWAPGGPCQDLGTYAGNDGLRASLPLDRIDAERQPLFEAAGDWYLLILELDGDRVASSVRTRFHAPAGALP